ncbi:RHS repeat-associated core domain-containing protein [Stackebrandtia soli]|uniref:RHS repeat-associated core domain-containing protein n=1 Tax=Stackebrandtia soli TaxID=1892856 RepID=UPI0039EBB825
MTYVKTSSDLKQYQLSDHHGTATMSLDPATGAIVHRRTDPYGNPRGPQPASGSWGSRKGFVGGTIDPTGLTHLGAREYDSTTGRFISIDPLIDQFDPQTMHGYAYSNNNPTTYSDPDGLEFCGDDACKTSFHRDSKGNVFGASDTRSAYEKYIGAQTLGNEPGVDRVWTLDEYSMVVNDGRSFMQLTHDEQQSTMTAMWCEHNPTACREYQEAASGTSIMDMVVAVLDPGFADATDCTNGDIGACATAALGFTPAGKLAKIADKIGDAIKVSTDISITIAPRQVRLHLREGRFGQTQQ